jgi:MoaA/NifB/PqqE/SkfB family radical SAM enzyme
MSRIIPDIPQVYDGKFPADYVNDVDGWNFPRERVEAEKGKMLTMDIDFGNDCSLRCPHCFRRSPNLDRGMELSYEETTDLIREGKELGLETVKFLGAGEPFEDPRLLDFLEFLNSENIKPLIFTKGHVTGDDRLAVKYHGEKGISSGTDLAKRIAELNARILLGLRHFDTEKEDRYVGNVPGYSLKRNRALELYVNAGLNEHNPTHLGISTIPVTKENLGEVFEIYKWARERNFYPIATPPMVGGRCSKESYLELITPSPEELLDFYTKICQWNIERGIQTLEEIKEDGISSYAGGTPCHQVACGVYVTLDGTVIRCPGDDVTVFGNVRENSLKEIWEGSENYQRAGTYNCGCPPKEGKTIPIGFYNQVIERLVEIYR